MPSRCGKGSFEKKVGRPDVGKALLKSIWHRPDTGKAFLKIKLAVPMWERHF